MKERGKYRTATTTVDDVRLSTVLWVDSSLVATVSADLGTEEHKVDRRRGRHVRPISCPHMIFVRGKWFRAVDVHDQLRLGKVHFVFSCKKKAWPKLFFGLIELTLVNIYIIVTNTNPRYKKMTQEEFRWKMVEEFVKEADSLDALAAVTEVTESTAEEETVASAKTALQIREEGRNGSHHHDIQPEYVSSAVAGCS